ncbi:hypothetical protein [Hyphomonas sp.]|uniref:hypothetical protein n=1 Tax=Hyphomonas sp. TaxID=87 RepID=UPI0025BEC3DE|nr:hypothetical protein [Hyphomonas sp.]
MKKIVIVVQTDFKTERVKQRALWLRCCSEASACLLDHEGDRFAFGAAGFPGLT